MNDLKTESPQDNIAIIGMAGRFPKADNLEEYWNNIIQGVNAATFFSDEMLKKCGVDQHLLNQSNYIKAKPYIEAADCFDASFFGFSAKEAKYLDPQIRLFLEVAYHALEDAAYNPDLYSNSVGIFAGASTSFEWYKLILTQKQEPTFSESFESWILSCKDFLSQIVSYRLNLTGPSYTIYTACSTSLAAIHLACQSLLRDECNIALAGGVTIDLPLQGGYVHEKGMIHSSDGICRPFDNSASGTLFGDGVGAVVLKKLSQAVKDRNQIYAVIKGSSCNNDGRRKTGFIAPSLEGQAEALKMTYQVSKTPIETIDYIETHGTGTKIGDPIEFESLTKVYVDSNSPCALGSVKANIGHLHAAAGVAGLIKAVLAIKHKTIPPLTHFKTPNSELRLKETSFYFPLEAKEWKEKSDCRRRAAISSLGVGGTNVHLVIEEYVKEKKTVTTNRENLIFPFSAKSPLALRKLINRFFDYIMEQSEIDLASIARTLQLGREAFAYRKVFIAHSKESLIQLNNESYSIHPEGCCHRPLILYCAPTDDINLSLFKERLNSPSLTNFNLLWQKVLNENLSKKVCLDVIKALEGIDHTDENYSIAKFIYHLQQVHYILSFGFSPNVYLGEREGTYIAAICANPNQFEEIFISYLHSVNSQWIFDKEKLETALLNVSKCNLSQLSNFYWDPQVALLIYGNSPDFSQKITTYRSNATYLISHTHLIDLNDLNHLISDMWQAGINVNWQQLKDKDVAFVSLPSYPFEKQKHWFESKVSSAIKPDNMISQEPNNLNEISIEQLTLKVKNIFLEILQVSSLNNHDNFYRKGGDSLQLIQIVSRINKEFKIEIDLEATFEVPTIANIVELLMKKITIEV